MNTTPADDREVLTTEEVMKVLGIGRRAAYEGVRSGIGDIDNTPEGGLSSIRALVTSEVNG